MLVDAGISARRITSGLADVGLSPRELDGILITHEHTDHISGLANLLKKAPVPVYAPETVAMALRLLIPQAGCIRPVAQGEDLILGGLGVIPFPTCHDTPESVGYRLSSDDGCAVAIATDTGCVTETMLNYMSGTDIALIEANHDVAMLRNGPYPPALKRRILSDRGHLSNAECLWLAAVLASRGTKRIVLGHLSRQNNLPALARRTVSRGLEGTDVRLDVAPELGCLQVEVAPCFT